ncbi:MAG: cyclic peptide export ABC transporter [Rhodocyclaceae bacterium]
MDLISLLFRSSYGTIVRTVLASVLSGALGAALLAIIHRALTAEGPSIGVFALAFGAVVLAKAASHFGAQVMLVRFGQSVILKLCRNLCDRVLAAPYDRIEAMGSPRLLATLNDDVHALSEALQAIPMLATNLAVLAGCAAYLVWLSWEIFLVSVLMVLAGVAGYRLLLGRAQNAIRTARDGRDRLFGNFRTLIEGVKELKLHAARREDFLRREIDTTTELLRTQNILAIRHYMIAQLWTQLLFFALIAMLLFGGRAITTLSAETLTGYVFATLYMMTPVWSLMETIPTFLRGKVSLAKINEIMSSLEAPADEGGVPCEIPGEGAVRIEFEGTVYGYPAAAGEEPAFSLGPIDLTLSSGELLFVTGGNGSGKSTLVKLLTGLYTPQSGRILLNGRNVDGKNRESYRQHFSAVFADYHLFDGLFGLDASNRAPEVQRYLKVLHMDRKVHVEDERFSTIALSSGQRKRLALLTAYLEDRPVYVFDEWAADQDPEYKEIFYKQLLPDLRKRAKAVVVVTHDDRYFHLGDRVVKLENGKVVTPASAALVA